MIYQTIDNASQFADAFRQVGRPNSFTYDGYAAMYEYFEEMGTDLELDPVAIDCEFAEYDSAINCIEDCGYDWDGIGDSYENDEEKEEAAREYLNDNTLLIVTPSSIIIQSF